MNSAEPTQPPVSRPLLQVLPLALVCALSLGLLCFLGFGEARRTYTGLAMDKLVAQGELVKASLDTFLLAGLPLNQYPGFTPLAGTVLSSDHTLAGIYVTDADGRVVFAAVPPGARPGALDLAGFVRSPNAASASGAVIDQDAGFYRATLPLTDKFETVGALHICVPKAVIAQAIDDRFAPVLAAAALLEIAFSATGILVIWRGRRHRDRWIAASFVLAFVLMAAVVIGTLTGLYVSGIQQKADSLTRSLAVRLQAPLLVGLDLSDFTGLDRTLAEYRGRNPDVDFIALTRGRQVIVQTRPAVAPATAWSSPGGDYEADSGLARAQRAHASGASAPTLVVRLGVPRGVVYAKLWQSVKNFTALFVASILLAVLLFNFQATLARRPRAGAASWRPDGGEHLLGLIAPLYFLIVLADSLNNSFLPQHFTDVAPATHAGAGAGASLFTIWFATYAAVLLPAGLLAERVGIKPPIIAGALLTAANLFLLTAVHSVPAFALTQALDGLGQGLIFVSVQTYILRVSTRQNRTRGAAIIVFGYNGGVLAGTAIGSLLAIDPTVGQQGVFLIGGLISVLMACYTVLLVPAVGLREAVAARRLPLRRTLAGALQDRRFMGAALLIAIPTKMIMAGLISATLPLVLAQQGYRTEDIGQVLICYSGGVLLAGKMTAGLADRGGDTAGLLALGSLGSGVGLLVAGLSGSQGSAGLFSTLALLAGLATLGLAHGCIQAASVTHVAHTATAQLLGQAAALSLYRLIERAGNIGGPLVVSRLLSANHGSPFTISLIGGGLLCCTVLFGLGSRSATLAPAPALPAS